MLSFLPLFLLFSHSLCSRLLPLFSSVDVHDREIHNVSKTLHQNSEFGCKPGEIQKKPAKSTLTFNGVVTQTTINFCGKLSSSCLLLLFHFFPCDFTAPTCTVIIITLKLCALNVEFPHFIPRFNKISLLSRHH